MFSLMLFPTLFSSIFTELGEKRWICNSSDLSVWYNYCDNVNTPFSITVEPCITLKGTKGHLYFSFIPRKDIKSLYFNLYLSINSVDFPKRTEVLCRGFDDIYSFCRTRKGETVNAKVSYSFKGIRFSKGQYKLVAEAITGSTEEMLFCLNFTVIHQPDFN